MVVSLNYFWCILSVQCVVIKTMLLCVWTKSVLIGGLWKQMAYVYNYGVTDNLQCFARFWVDGSDHEFLSHRRCSLWNKREHFCTIHLKWTWILQRIRKNNVTKLYIKRLIPLSDHISAHRLCKNHDFTCLPHWVHQVMFRIGINEDGFWKSEPSVKLNICLHRFCICMMLLLCIVIFV